jgi:hypothetical protein
MIGESGGQTKGRFLCLKKPRICCVFMPSPSRLTAYAKLTAWLCLLIGWARALQIFGQNFWARLNASPHLPDLPCNAPQCDFSLFWPAGLLVGQGHAAVAYQPHLLQGLRETLFWHHIEPTAWIYPPPALFAVWPLKFFSFETGFWAWSFWLLVLAVGVLRLAGLGWRIIGLALLSPAALWNFQLGQFGLLTGAILVAGLALVERRPLLAGGVLAFLVIKPQPGLLAPIGFLARGSWRAIAAGAVMGLVLMTLSYWAFGAAAWAGYLSDGLAMARYILQLPLPDSSGYVQFGVSVFWALRSLGAGLGVCYAAQGAISLAAAATTWVVWRRCADATDRLALTVFLSLLVTPYGYVDDMVAWSIAILVLAQRRAWHIDLLDALAFLWPLLGPALFTATGVLFTPLVVVLVAARTWRRAAKAGAETPSG